MAPAPGPGPGGRRAPRRSTAKAPDHLERTDRWNGLRRGDPVEIDGVAGRSLSWTFQAFVRNARNGSEAVEVLGGRPGQQLVRSFRPDQVFPVGGRRRGTPSLDDAPQLPLG